VVFHCPFEGPTDPARALEWIRNMADLGVEDICLADTDGNAAPERTAALLDEAQPMLVNMGYGGLLSLHLHNTYGYAARNARLALQRGIRHFDAATAGLGGCPFVPGAKGNIATEELVQLCHEEGYATGHRPGKLAALSQWLVGLKAQRQAVEVRNERTGLRVPLPDQFFHAFQGAVPVLENVFEGQGNS
jgi:isopropylmalate/homocitrate/citramalate synthase